MAPTPNEVLITNFLTAVQAENINTVANTVTTFFTQDNPSRSPTTPCVGISEHGLDVGPAFRGQAQIGVLLTELFTSFTNLNFVPVGALLYSQAQDGKNGAAEIGVPGNLEGEFTAAWFNSGNYVSRPLSFIPVTNKTLADPKNAKISPGIPTFALFTFQGGLILRLALYLDRFKFVLRLGEEQNVPPNLLASDPVNRVAGERHRSRVTIQID